MALNFPSSPSVNDEYTDPNGVVWICTSNTVGNVIWARKSNLTDYVEKAGDTMTGQLKGITPVAAADLTRKDYVDGKITYETLDTNGDVGAGAGQLAIGNHTHNFTDLNDTPANYTGAGGYTVKVNSGATGLEFVASSGGSAIPSGSVMVFHQASAPIGWTQDTTYNDQALRVVSGAGGGGGGSNGFLSRLVNAYNTAGFTVSTSYMQSHNHGGGNHRHSKNLTSNSSTTTQGWNRGQNLGGTYYTNYSGTIISTQGSNAAHSHSVTNNILYRNVILASKD